MFRLQVFVLSFLLCSRRSLHRIVSAFIKDSFSLWSHGLEQYAVDRRKEANLFEKNGLNVDMIFVGVSTVMVQSMLSGSANVAGLGGPAVVSNVLRGGDIIQIAATVPYFTQSLMVRPQITELGGLRGKKVGITRFGAVTDLALRALLERNNIKDITILQMGG